MRNSLPSLLLLFVGQTLHSGSEVLVSDAVETACKLYVDTEDQNSTRLRRDRWEAPNGMPATQTLPRTHVALSVFTS